MERTINSREIARITKQRHTEVVRKIKTFNRYILTDAKLRRSDYFIPSSYVARNGERRKCFECTELGCEVIANKLTGPKGTRFTAFYVKKFHQMKRALPQNTGNKLLHAPRPQLFLMLYKQSKHEELLAQENKKHERIERTFRSTKKNILVGQLSKVICNSGYKIGPYQLFSWLRSHGYLIRYGRQHNAPKQKYIDQGLFRVSERTFPTATGQKMSITPLVTPKGQQYFVKRFLRKSEIHAN